MKQKWNSQSGFTLAETLLAVLILLLVSVIVANGVPVATNAFNKVIIGSNAKVLLSTAISALRDELATARDLAVGEDGKTITYFSADKGALSEISLDDSKEIKLQEYKSIDPLTGIEIYSVPARYLVPKSAATSALYVTYDGATYTAGNEYITISGLGVYMKSNTDTPMASTDLKIRVLVPAAT